MAKVAMAHPTAQQLAQYGLGKLGEAASGQIEAHLDSCAKCQQVLAAQSQEDGLVALVKKGGAAETKTGAGNTNLNEGTSAEPAGQAKVVTAASSGLKLPERFGKYTIKKLIGQGGMGAVYLARDNQLDRDIGLKVPRLLPDDRPEVLERFYREARAAATFNHPHLCPIYEVAAIDGIHYLTMPFIKGQSLCKYLEKTGPLPQRQAAALVRKLALAMDEAHTKGVIHRDLKPGNVMLNQRGEPIIMDFGLARRDQAADNRLTRSGAVMGTPAYMPPEQVSGDQQAIGPCTDIYSMGVILYELLTGRLPFQGSAALQMGLVMTQEPDRPSLLRPDLDGPLEAIILRAMMKRPEERYPSMKAFADDLTSYLRANAPSTAGAAKGRDVDGPALLELGDDTQPRAFTTAVPKSGPSRFKPSRKVWLIAAAAAVPLLILASIVIIIVTSDNKKTRIETDGKTTRIETDDPNAKITIQGTGPAQVVTPASDQPPESQPQESEEEPAGRELLRNGGCEEPLDGRKIPGWVAVQGRWLPGGLDAVTPPWEGKLFFHAMNSARGELVQDVDVTAFAAAIDAGKQKFKFIGHVRSHKQDNPDLTRVVVEYRDAANGRVLEQYDSGLAKNVNVWKPVIDKRFAPVGTRLIRVRLLSIRTHGDDNGGYHDGLSLQAVPPPVEKQDFVPLFNGKDLTGWKVHPSGTGEWKVKDGAILGTGPRSHLFSERGDYENFHLRCEAKINAGGNSGLYFRTEFGEGLPKGYEAQILEGVNQLVGTGSLYPAFDPAITPETRARIVVNERLHQPDEWFTLEVIAQGNHIVIKVNGKTTVDFVDEKKTYRRGHFALQQHNPQTKVWFRKVEVKELSRVPLGDAGVKVEPENKPPPVGETKQPLDKELTNSIGMTLALIPTGKFIMGSPPDERGRSNEEVPHEVEITRPFYLGASEVTQEQYERVIGTNPSVFTLARVGSDTKRFPVENVSWEDAREFCRKLAALPDERQAGRTYRLPTEAEWEYACRGGSTASQPFYLDQPRASIAAADAIFFRNLGMRTTQVGSYKPNAFGLYDMHGSVWEWCADWYDKDFYKSSPRQDPTGPSASPDNSHVLRGGSWTDGDFNCRAAARAGSGGDRTDRWGFRVVCEAGDAAPAIPAAKPSEPNPKPAPAAPAAAPGPSSPKFTNTLNMKFALVPKGKAWLGGRDGMPGNTEVEIPYDFFLGVYEVTQEEWQKVLGKNPSRVSRVGTQAFTDAEAKRFPVNNVSWFECREFVKQLNEQMKETGWEYRLPTEREWEYACRGGPGQNKDVYGFNYYAGEPSNTLASNRANFSDTGLKRPCQVGTYSPNRLGLYDMHGNIAEWCNDEKVPPDASGKEARVNRGGSWWENADYCKPTWRSRWAPGSGYAHVGLRVARVPAANAAGAATEPNPSTIPADRPGEWKPLFNGKDLTGWKVDSGDARSWRVQNGAIVVTANPANRGWLLSEKEYGDALVRLEFQLTAEANSGVAVRARPGSIPEIQLLDDSALKYRGEKPDRRTGALHAVAIDQSALLKPVGGWNELELELRGQLLRVSVNGRPTVITPLGNSIGATGRIGFQNWDGTVRFRKIEIKELPANP